MSTAVMAACWPLQMPPTPKSVLISLADNANDHGECWPSIPKIAERTCFSERAVHAAIRWLEEARVVSADRSNGRHTRYVVTPDAYQPPQEVHHRSSRTTAAPAVKPPQEVQEPPQLPQSPPQEVRSNRKEPSRTVKATGRKSRAQETTFDQWNDQLGDDDAIPETDPIFGWVRQAGIPEDYLELAWLAFADRFTGNTKRYTDWRATFRNYVKGGWLELWKPAREGGYYLTDAGQQWARVRDAERKEAA